VYFQIERKKKFKRLRRLDDDESGDERGEDDGEDREAIANELFEGSDNVSEFQLSPCQVPNVLD